MGFWADPSSVIRDTYALVLRAGKSLIIGDLHAFSLAEFADLRR
jgi:hypothetical protein